MHDAGGSDQENIHFQCFFTTVIFLSVHAVWYSPKIFFLIGRFILPRFSLGSVFHHFLDRSFQIILDYD